LPQQKNKEKKKQSKNIREQINQDPGEKHKGIKKTKKQRNLNTEEHYKTENNHYRDYVP
jgi:hypothetical protein